MDNNINHWKSELDTITADFKTLLATISEQDLNWRPNNQTWSIAQNLEHLIVINSSYFPIIEKALQRNLEIAWPGRVKFIYNMIGKTLVKASDPNRRKKLKTFPVWLPSESNIPGDILIRFEDHQQELKQYMDKSHSLLLNNTVIYSPANKMIVYKLATAFDILVLHERRHYNQASELIQLIKREGN